MLISVMFIASIAIRLQWFFHKLSDGWVSYCVTTIINYCQCHYANEETLCVRKNSDNKQNLKEKM